MAGNLNAMGLISLVGLIAISPGLLLAAGPVTLDQVISRESPLLDCSRARLTVGQDGRAYLASTAQGKGFVLRVSLDGREKQGGEVVYAIHNATNAGGVIATANAHFNHAVNLYDANFAGVAAANDFRVGDDVGWDAPLHVEAGASGDFYGVDQHRNRVLRIGPEGKVKAVYPIRAEGEPDWGGVHDVRVCERNESFYWLTGNKIRRVDVQGRTVWTIDTPVAYRWDVGGRGGWDVDEEGVLYTLDGTGEVVHKFAPDGKPAGDAALQMGEFKPTADQFITALRVFGGQAVVKRTSPVELFQVYDLASGQPKHVELIRHERLMVGLPSLVWTAGEQFDAAIEFSKNGQPVPPAEQPAWRVWASPWGLSDWRSVAGTLRVPQQADGTQSASAAICVPADFAGLYQIKVSPEVQPRQTGEPSEYLVREVVEVRQPNTHGTATVVTPYARSAYGRGEAIRGRVMVRTAADATPGEVQLRLVGDAGCEVWNVVGSLRERNGSSTVADGTRSLPATMDFVVPAEVTLALRPGAYRLDVAAAGLTCVGQPIAIGAGMTAASGFRTMLYGDYQITFPQRNAWESADAATWHAERMQRLGVNQFVNRANWAYGLDFANNDEGRGLIQRLQQRLAADPLAVASERADLGAPHHSILAAYSALGMREMLMLVNMDGGLPLGTGHDRRTPEQFAENIARYTAALRDYPALYGWDWVANWWLYEQDAKFASPDEKAAYDAALKVVRETGRWDPILDRVDDRKIRFAVDAQELFNRELRKVSDADNDRFAAGPADRAVADALPHPQAATRSRLNERAPRFRTASSGPCRRPEVYPPVNFANVDEVDVHYQAEQIATPAWAAHGIDYLRRPGKPVWGHPELFNDSGTGEQILPALWSMVMRGADGVGTAGLIPHWENVPSDPRGGYHGTASVFRAVHEVLRQYGPWLTTLNSADRVAIVVSPRQLKTETFCEGLGSLTFSRQFEAYQSCLYAHCPATFVFAENLRLTATPTTCAEPIVTLDAASFARPDGPAVKQDGCQLDEFDAVLIVGQTVEFEPPLLEALHAAKQAGVKVLADGTCRAELVAEFEPLGLSFGFVEKEHAVNNDHAFYTYPARFAANATALRDKLAAVRPAGGEIRARTSVAAHTDPIVLASERSSGKGRFLWLVNQTPTPLDPGVLRRVGRAVATSTPVLADVKLDGQPGAVYDVFAQRQAGREFTADLRDSHARLYAILPRPIGDVTLTAPTSVKAGQALDWALAVLDDQGLRLPSTVPVHLRLLDGENAVVEERFSAAEPSSNTTLIVVPVNLPPGGLTLEATELISGRSAQVKVAVEAMLARQPGQTKNTGAREVSRFSASLHAPRGPMGLRLNEGFGPHLRDVALSRDGRTALCGAFNWDENLYAVDLQTGDVLGAGRVGDQFAYAPLPLGDDFAVQGYDLMSAEGYHLYVVPQGAGSIQPTHRFALPGLPACLTGWAFTAWTQDRINNFAAPASGQWIAAAGNLGLAVWAPSGELRWSQDWSRTQRRSPRLAALGDATLLSGEGVTVTAHAAADGKRVWEHKLAVTGEILGLHAGADGRTLAVRTSSDGGRVFVVRDGQTIAELITPADDLSLSPDGTQLAVATGQQLKWYTVDSGLKWTFSGDDVLNFPRIAPEGRRVAVASQLGSLYVLDADGGTLHDRDTQAIAVPAWLPDGDLLLAGWMGRVERLDGRYQTRWSKLVRSVVPALRDGTVRQPFQAVRDGNEKGTGTDRPDPSQFPVLSEPAALPTSRITSWFTAAGSEPPAGPNLLEPNKFILRLMLGDYRATSQNPENSLADGSREAPAQPWLTWLDHGMIESGWRGEFALEVDAFNRQLHVEAITLVEDAAHPESWLRDARLQYWDAAAERWVPADYLVSDSAVHAHRLARPIEAARFRLVKSDGHAWPAGNVRLAELILHGRSLGASHPDVVARRPVAVLFDENVASIKGSYEHGHNPGLKFVAAPDAFSGGNYIRLDKDSRAGALWQPPFGHMVPNWRFEIVERPEPGQYRYVEFAWQALSPETKGITLQLAEAHHGGVAICAGQSTDFPSALLHKAADAPPRQWQTVRVDLWQVLPENQRKPWTLGAMALGTAGGPAAFDRLRLGRSEADFGD